MAELYEIADERARASSIEEVRAAVARGELVVLPTDTLYGIGANAFNPAAVDRLIAAKQRTRQSPPPVLVANFDTVRALAAEITEPVQQLAEAFWPGPLTLVLFAQPSLQWDLGETEGTVALRMPDHAYALELLAATGPLAVSSANLHGEKPAITAAAAQEMFGDSVAVYLENGELAGSKPSTILDVTQLATGRDALRVLRDGAITRKQIQALLPEVTIEG
ncbi:MAG: L-threonylcarbamoyladenylate synthase [Microbacteriaceae bacterium]|nr:L-threonylcarbamoyladenylate synthase [Microbacteriaceae bacterium]